MSQLSNTSYSDTQYTELEFPKKNDPENVFGTGLIVCDKSQESSDRKRLTSNIKSTPWSCYSKDLRNDNDFNEKNLITITSHSGGYSNKNQDCVESKST